MIELNKTMLSQIGHTTYARQIMETEGEDYQQYTAGFDFPNLCIYKIKGEIDNLGGILKEVGFHYDTNNDEWRTTNQRWYEEALKMATESERETIRQLNIEKELI